MKNGLLKLMENIEMIRRSKKMTRTELAVAVGVKSNTLNVMFYRIRKGRMPSVDIHLLYKISEALDCNICDLLGEEYVQ